MYAQPYSAFLALIVWNTGDRDLNWGLNAGQHVDVLSTNPSLHP